MPVPGSTIEFNRSKICSQHKETKCNITCQPLIYGTTGADWLYFLARAQFDQTSLQIVENVNQSPEILRNANVSMLSRNLSLRASARIA